MKTCTKCGVEKELSEFHKHKNKPDGHTYACKECAKARTLQYRKENPERAKGSVRKWRDENREYLRDYSSDYRRENREDILRNAALYRAENPEKIKAQHVVNHAVERDSLPRAATLLCVDCERRAAHYHHEDYDKPLEVVSLCHSCHKRRHRR